MSKHGTCERLGDADFPKWDEFVSRSPQGTIFNTTKWYGILEEVLAKKWLIYGCHKKGNLLGGCIIGHARRAGFDCLLPPLFTPYQGFLLRPRTSPRTGADLEDCLQIVDELEKTVRIRHSMVVLVHHPSLSDLRPLVWSGWEIIPRYTFRLGLDCTPETFAAFRHDIRSRIARAGEYGITVRPVQDIAACGYLYAASYRRHRRAAPIAVSVLTNWFRLLSEAGLARAWIAVDREEKLHAFRIIIQDGRTAYDWVAGADSDLVSIGAPSLLVWTIMGELSPECDYLDFMGANTRSIAAFKAGFGAPLTSYAESRAFRSPLHRSLFAYREGIARFVG